MRHFLAGTRQSSDSGHLGSIDLVVGEVVEDQLVVLLGRRSMPVLGVEEEAWRDRSGIDSANGEESEWPCRN